MYIQLSQQIRDLTIQAAGFVNENKIEKCLEILIKRQTLLENLIQEYKSATEIDQAFKQCVIELITWIQEQDLVNNNKVITLRELSKENTVKQRKTTKAIQHYKNII